ncbi:Isochorismatase hydrolase [Xylariaceae sp. AK1471]|nr:Isochorismatase hydrolase [Xylariaceae sp. AK1471]
MSNTNTALLLVDPYNDFLHEEGKLYHRLAESIKDSDTIKHLFEAVKAARKAGIPIFYCMHQQTNAHSYKGWTYLNASQQGLGAKMVFEEGSFGAQFYEGLQPDLGAGDVVVSKHWNSSSFANTDLHYQLHKRGISEVVFAGLVANTCIEATARYAYEHGYEITMLSDATAGFSTELKNVATNLIWPLFANRVYTTAEWADSIKGDAA